MKRVLEGLVREALRNAKDNGHDFEGKSDRHVAEDMNRCDAYLEHYLISDIERVVARLRAEKKK